MQTHQTLACPESGRIDDIVAIDDYQLDRPDSNAWCELVDRTRTDLTTHGACSLPGFLKPEALTAIADQLRDAEPHVPIRKHTGTVYARKDIGGDSSHDDPRCRPLAWNAGHVTRDMIPAFAPAHRLYVSPLFKRFISACVGLERVFEYADPLAGLVATILPPGGEYPWHYDTNEFVVTIMIQAAQTGGRFAYCKDLRRPGDENLDGLSRILDGQDDHTIRHIDARPGDFQLFLGRYSLHQVTPVGGDVARHVLVLSYSDRAGVIGPIDRTREVYGRVTEAHLIAAERRVAADDGLIL